MTARSPERPRRRHRTHRRGRRVAFATHGHRKRLHGEARALGPRLAARRRSRGCRPGSGPSPPPSGCILLHVPEVRANGVSLYYEEHGTGAPILCIHGTSGSAAVWADAAAALATRGRTIIYDRRACV